MPAIRDPLPEVTTSDVDTVMADPSGVIGVVLGARAAYGRLDYYFQPLFRGARRWVDSSRLEPVPDRIEAPFRVGSEPSTLITYVREDVAPTAEGLVRVLGDAQILEPGDEEWGR